MPRVPRFAQLGIDMARGSRHELGGFSAGSLQLRVSRRALAVRRSRVKRRTRGRGDVCGHALDIALRQLAGGAGADQCDGAPGGSHVLSRCLKRGLAYRLSSFHHQ